MLRVLVIAESQADQRLVCGLADRVLTQQWTGDADVAGLLSALRSWIGIEPGTTVLRWRDIKKLSQTHRPAQLRSLGFRQGQSGEDREALHKALILAELHLGGVRTAIVSRDLDTRAPAAREESLHATAGQSATRGWTIIFAAAKPMAEAWLLHGYEPANSAERKALTALRSELGFDPTC
jgi:hypothetical protein